MYLIMQWWIYLLLAALIGFLIGYWWGKCRCNTHKLEQERDAALAELMKLKASAPVAAATAVGLDVLASEPPTNATFKPSPVAAMDAASLEKAVLAAGIGMKPKGLSRPQNGTPDDLKEIGGVGPKNETWLHEQGLYHFWQIATLDIPGIAWLAHHLPNFGSRVYRENWVDQAVKLARGEMTDAKAKYQEGKHV
jgi:predicted flap endonuclease-1-like 5' DNA nuclease